jgi:hypothetical protein
MADPFLPRTWTERHPAEVEADRDIDSESFHDFRDTVGNPTEKRDRGSASDWSNSQERYSVPGLGRM